MLLQDKMQKGEWVIVAADRVPVQSDRVQHVDFLGESAAFPQGAWILANLLQSACYCGVLLSSATAVSCAYSFNC